MPELTPDRLDDLTVQLTFALRDSLTDVSPLDFWQGRAITALATAAAGAGSIQQAITIAARKLQIDGFDAKSSPIVVAVAKELGPNFQQWATHLDKTLVYIIALARAANSDAKESRRAAKQPASATQTANELPNF